MKCTLAIAIIALTSQLTDRNSLSSVDIAIDTTNVSGGPGTRTIIYY